MTTIFVNNVTDEEFTKLCKDGLTYMESVGLLTVLLGRKRKAYLKSELLDKYDVEQVETALLELEAKKLISIKELKQ
jgi:hypothetical protein